VPAWLPPTATGGLTQGPSSGLYLPKDRVIPFLKALRSNLKGFGESIKKSGHDPEEGLAWLIAACVEAKEIRPECGILELREAWSPQATRAASPTETARALATNPFPNAVLKEVRKALGTAVVEAPAPLPARTVTAPPPNPHANEPAQPY